LGDIPDQPLHFLMQIKLAEVAPFDAGKILPKSGMVWFFILWEHEDDELTLYILFRKGTVRGLRPKEAPDDLPEEQRDRGLELIPCLEWTVPSREDTNLDEEITQPHLGFWTDIQTRVAQAQGFENPRGPESVHRMLGHPQLLQTPGLADGTKLLLQVESDAPQPLRGQYPQTGMIWGDCGRVYFRIGDKELREQRFDEKPWMTLEMC
jgi:uncharacterized protein YwqG